MSSRCQCRAWSLVSTILLLSPLVTAEEAPKVVTEEGKKLTYQTLSSGRFSGQNLTGAKLSYSTLNDAAFDNAIMKKADIRYVAASDARFNGADLQGALFRYSVLADASFKNAICRDADFSWCVLADADFSGADLSGAKFSSALMSSEKRHYMNTIYDAKTEFPRGFDPKASGLTLRE